MTADLPSTPAFSDQLSALEARLAHLCDLPDGVVAHREGQFGQIVVAKKADELFMVFCPSGVPLSNDALSGVMSRINLTAPLTLTGAYTQAMLACLAFVPDPRRVYVMGGGGGRVPMVLHALLPDVVVQGAEIDPDVLALSRAFFGLSDDPRLTIACADGVQHLGEQEPGVYDHIYLDCFAADGRVPPDLATPEFFANCASKLSDGGVMCVNLVDSDPEFDRHCAAFASVFRVVHRVEHGGSHVFFTQREYAPEADIQSRAQTLAERLPFGFDFAELVGKLSLMELRN